MISPIKAPGAYDIFKLDKITSPGKSTITSCNGRQLTFQEQQSPGLTGAFVTFKGEKLVQVTYRIEVWTEADLQAMERLTDYMNAAKNVRPVKALKLIDLRLAALRIPQMAVAKVPYQQTASAGLWAYELDFQEYKRQILPNFAHPKTQIEGAIEAKQLENGGLRGEIAAAKARARAGK